MDNSKMMKKGSSSLMGILVGVILVIGMFTGFFLFFEDQLSKNDLSMESKYNDTYDQLTEVRADMDTRVNEIKSAADDVEEADSTFLAAINGLKGLYKTLKLLLGFTSDAIDTSQAIYQSTDVVPSWVQLLSRILLTALVILIIIDVWLGRKPLVK